MAAILKTDRLHLRPIALADAKRVAEFTREPDVARLIELVPIPNPLIAAEGYILIAQARSELKREYTFAIEAPGGGMIGVASAQPKPCGAEIFFWIGKPYWGRGFGTEAAHAIAEFGEGLSHGPVTARHFADSPASGRVLEKAGFAYTGEVRALFALSRGESAPSRAMVRRQTRLAAA